MGSFSFNLNISFCILVDSHSKLQVRIEYKILPDNTNQQQQVIWKSS